MYLVAPNAGGARSGTLTIAGLTFTVSQADGQGCTYQVSVGPLNSTALGYSGSVNVNSPSGCQWTATSNASWLTISSGASGTGNGTVLFLAGYNITKTQRTGTLTVAGYQINLTEGAH
jgi:hypothetical protein